MSEAISIPAVHEELSAMLNDLRRAVTELIAAGETIKQPYFAAVIGEDLARAHVRAQSPWVSREDAALYAGNIGTTAIDHALATPGLGVKRYQVGNRVLLKKSEIDAAIESGKWPMQIRKAA